MIEQKAEFIGIWEKKTDAPCSRVYPARIQFRESGLYYGTGAKSGQSPEWDIGTWEIASPTRVKISTAHDAIITYEFSISNGILTFVDPVGCEFKYQRARGLWLLLNNTGEKPVSSGHSKRRRHDKKGRGKGLSSGDGKDPGPSRPSRRQFPQLKSCGTPGKTM